MIFPDFLDFPPTSPDCLRTIFGQIGIWDSTHCSGHLRRSPACNYGIDDRRRNLQRSQEVLQAGLRSGFIGSCKHGHYRCVVHAEGYPWRRGESSCDWIFHELLIPPLSLSLDLPLLFRWPFQNYHSLLDVWWNFGEDYSEKSLLDKCFRKILNAIMMSLNLENWDERKTCVSNFRHIFDSKTYIAFSKKQILSSSKLTYWINFFKNAEKC